VLGTLVLETLARDPAPCHLSWRILWQRPRTASAWAPTATGLDAQVAETNAAFAVTSAAVKRVHRARTGQETQSDRAAEGSRSKGTSHTAAASSQAGSQQSAYCPRGDTRSVRSVLTQGRSLKSIG